MLKEVGASGQISLGKKYAGQLFDVQFIEDGRVELTPVKVVPAVQERPAGYTEGNDWPTPEHMVRRKTGAARTPARMEQARTRWENENKEAIEAMNQRIAGIGSMAQRLHAWRKDRLAPEPANAPTPGSRNA